MYVSYECERDPGGKNEKNLKNGAYTASSIKNNTFFWNWQDKRKGQLVCVGGKLWEGKYILDKG